MVASVKMPSNETDISTTKNRFYLRLLVFALTLSLWKGWAEENKFLDMQVFREDQLLEHSNAPGLFPTFEQHMADVSERENRYRQRQKEQPFKLLPIAFVSVLAGWLMISRRMKGRIDALIEIFHWQAKMSRVALTVAAMFVTTIAAWLICGHAATGAFCALLVSWYLYLIGRQSA